MFLKAKLLNGTRVIAEKNDTLGSVSVGFFTLTGQRDERHGEEGLSHMIEHMLFKGTDKRSAKDISVEMDEIGGQINAFTAKEYTGFYARCLSCDVDIALDILSDLLTHSKLADSDLAMEKGVVIEEINMVDDTPEDLVHDMLSTAYYGEHPLALPILGTRESVSSFTRENILSYMSRHYTPSSFVIAIAGNFDFDHVVQSLNELTRDWPFTGTHEERIETEHLSNPGRELLVRDTEQMHICLGYRGVKRDSPMYYPMMVFSNIFGGGMSSYLFQSIREERGLAYSVYSYPSSYLDTGLFTIYAGMTTEQSASVIEITKREIKKVLDGKMTDDELRRGRNQLRGSYLLSAESGSNRMMSIGRNYLLTGEALTPEETVDLISAVTMDDVMQVAEYSLTVEPAVAAIGPKAGIDAALAELDKK